MKRIRDNGLTIVLILATAATLVGMLFSGMSVYNEELAQHGRLPVTLGGYIMSGQFLSALFENWESEFLQMSVYVVLTAYLFQRGSAESKDPDAADRQNEEPSQAPSRKKAPWPVRAGGVIEVLYSYSLGLTLALLFVASFLLHLWYSLQAENLESALHGRAAMGVADHLASAQFWFESFQNWQSEFLSTAVLVLLSIVLRFRGSPESKPVAAPHAQTGD